MDIFPYQLVDLIKPIRRIRNNLAHENKMVKITYEQSKSLLEIFYLILRWYYFRAEYIDDSFINSILKHIKVWDKDHQKKTRKKNLYSSKEQIDINKSSIESYLRSIKEVYVDTLQSQELPEPKKIAQKIRQKLQSEGIDISWKEAGLLIKMAFDNNIIFRNPEYHIKLPENIDERIENFLKSIE